MLITHSLQKLNMLQQALLGYGGLDEKFKYITDSVVEIFHADFCRIWIKGPGDLCEKGCVHANTKDPEKLCRMREYCLHLIASSGRYTHIDGPHRRVPFGFYKIGRIADGQTSKFLTNDVAHDPQIGDHAWAKGLGLVSFAGYKLQDTNGEPRGVLALFSKRAITPEEDAMLEGIAGMTAHVILAAKVEEALKMERDKLRNILESMNDGVYIENPAHDVEYINPVIEREFGPIDGRKCHKYFNERDEVCLWCKSKEVFAGKTVRWEWRSSKNNKTYDLLEAPLRNPDGNISKLVIFRDITERKYTEEEIRLSQSITQTISEAKDFHSALKTVMQKVCEATDWVFGETWMPSFDGARLECSPVWYSNSEGLKKFRIKSEKFTFPPGVGLPGRVWRSKSPAWVEDVTKDENFPRAAIAMEAGIKAGVAIPIMAEKEVVAVTDFFMFEPKKEDKRFIKLISSIATQIALLLQRKKAEHRLAIQYSVVRVLAESAALQEATPKIIEAICESTGWDMGAIWIVDHQAGVLRCVEHWRRPSVDFSEFEVITKQYTFSRGVGLPGHVWETGKPEWIVDVTQNTNFPRAPYAAKVGLNSAFCFPIRFGGETLGVIEFFSREIRQPDDDLLHMFNAIGSQIGQFIERKRVEEQNSHLAYYDILTDLPNRLFLHDEIDRAISQARKELVSFALLIINLDRFEEINNTVGHSNGDLILQQIAIRLKGICGEPNRIARMGGDIFAAVLQKTGAEAAAKRAAEIIEVIKAPLSIADLSLEISASIGIALFSDHGTDADTLIRRAEITMYVAKKIESSIWIYSPQFDQYSQKRLALMGELRQAIEQEQMFLLYQPKVDLQTGKAIGVEALCRWQHPKLGVIPPNDFIYLAERGGLIKELTLWVIKESMRQSRIWHKEGFKVAVATNISVRNLQHPQFLDKIKGLISTWGINPGTMRFEITESIIMQNPELAMETITELTSMGIKFSIDDFGTGYSSLSYLQRLPVDEIKIDKSFVINMETDKNKAMIVRSVIEMVHNLGMKVTAEGVENKEVMDKLISLGCDDAQGYYISKPIPHEELVSWMGKQ